MKKFGYQYFSLSHILCISIRIPSSRYPQHMSCDMRKPDICICENKDADQLRGNRNFKPLVIFCGCTARFVSDLVGNPEDQLSHNEAHMILLILMVINAKKHLVFCKMSMGKFAQYILI